MSSSEPRLSWEFSPVTTKQQHYWSTHWNGDGPPRIVISDESDSATMGQQHSAQPRKKRSLSAPSNNLQTEHVLDTQQPAAKKPEVLKRLSSALHRADSRVGLRVRLSKHKSTIHDPRRDSALTEGANSLRKPSMEQNGDPATITTEVESRALDANELALSEKVRSMYEKPETLEDRSVLEESNIEPSEVDRYGFVIQESSARTSNEAMPAINEDEPTLSKRSPLRLLQPPHMIHKSSRRSLRHAPSVHSQARSMGSMRSVSSYTYLRHATNRLPHNRDRRHIDEAGLMLSPPMGFYEVPKDPENSKAAIQLKKREWLREDKWRRMSTKVSGTGIGGGKGFSFDALDHKVIARTWKGIPDRWRSCAWFSFLSSSAKKDPHGATENVLLDTYRTLQTQPSPDDYQIDMDVPRTINNHILFNRRYGGGQRLLFRVLHAFSLHLPRIGYVQGMAAIAATLLCYYDEERAFVMMVWMFKYRGLTTLYEQGFTGLMSCLKEFEDNFLSHKTEVATRLNDLGIVSMTYGTRWYLTLFNYSLPFAAQLRIWDVFMLLGDGSYAPNNPYGADLDLLHATSAALIDACREVLEIADFENAMKTLTSFIAVKDNDKLMTTTQAEWKLRKSRAKKE